MLDFLYEVLAKKGRLLKEEISGLIDEQDLDEYRREWRNLKFSEERAIIGAEDGSINHKRYKDFVLYAVNATALVYSRKMKEIKYADIGILHPYKHIEERLRLYRSIFELKTSLGAIDRCDLFMMDGSLISDLITPTVLDMALTDEEKREVIDLLPKVDEFDGVEINSLKYSGELDGEKSHEKIAFLEYLEYLTALRALIEKAKGKLVGISKSSTGNHYFNEGLPDIAIFEHIVKNPGYSSPKRVEIKSEVKRKFPVHEDFFKKLEFTTSYVNLDGRKGVFMFEIPREIEEEEIIKILCKIKSTCVDGYPYLLKKAHRRVVISGKDMEKIALSLGITAKTGREML